MKQTPTYRLEYFDNGDFYSASSDFRRFVTLDYNFKTYVGIVGDGIAKGWDLEVLPGYNPALRVRISFGSGFVGGLYCETNWVRDYNGTKLPPKKKDAQANDYLIIKEIPGYSSPNSDPVDYPNYTTNSELPPAYRGGFYQVGGSSFEDVVVVSQLGPEGEDLNLDGVIDGVLRPVFAPPPEDYFYDNPFVVAVKKELSDTLETGVDLNLVDDPEDPLQMNRDYYVFAVRNSDDPNDPSVFFVKSSSPVLAGAFYYISIAKVLVRDGKVGENGIDYSFGSRLQGLSGTTASLTKELLKAHRHGGGAPYDPPRISLVTDIRQMYFSKLNKDGTVEYIATASRETGATNGHRHTYAVDSNGNGYTQEVIGDALYHIHEITAFTLGSPIAGYGVTVEPHIHSIESSIDPWGDNSPVLVRVNGVPVTAGYKVEGDLQTIVFNPGVAQVHSSTYESLFPINATTLYSFTEETDSVNRFVLHLINNFYAKYQAQVFPPLNDNGTAGTATIRDPFTFWLLNETQNIEPALPNGFVNADPTPININPTGEHVVVEEEVKFAASLEQAAAGNVNTTEIVGDLSTRGFSAPLKAQAAVASQLLKKVGDSFTLLPYLARFIPVVLKKLGYSDVVTVEVLNNAEVTGVLSGDNIFFVEADKFAKGQFTPVQIPFLGHVGRIGEAMEVVRSQTFTNDKIGFYVIPSVTTSTEGHRHKVYLNRSGNGVTTVTEVDGEPTVYVDVNGTAILISHAHGIENGVVASATSSGINQWQGTSAAHIHALQAPISGDAKSVFGVVEDAAGNLFMGTSDGMIVSAATLGYRVVVNGRPYNLLVNTPAQAVANALTRHLSAVGEIISLTDSVAAMVALEDLTSDGQMLTLTA